MTALRDLPGFPAAVADTLGGSFGLRTVGDLRAFAATLGADPADAAAVRTAFVHLAVPAEHLDQAVFAALTAWRPKPEPAPAAERKTRKKKAEPLARAGETPHPKVPDEPEQGPVSGADLRPGAGEVHPAEGGAEGAVHPVRTEEGPPPAEGVRVSGESAGPVGAGGEDHPLTDAADFTGDEPPPRRRPAGHVPALRYVKLPTGVSVLAEFLCWDREVRIPAGCVLCKWVGSDFGTRPPYVVASYPPAAGEPLGRLGGGVGEAELGGYAERVQVHTQRPSETWTVFAPREQP